MDAGFHKLTLVALIAATLVSSETALAAKAKFERTKPHVNVGTIGHQGVSILATNLRSNLDDPTPCDFSGELLATDNTPDRLAPDEVLRVPIELAEGASLAVPIPHPLHPAPDGMRREISVEISPDETSDRRCSIATAVVGYDSDFQSTQYLSPHRVSQIDRFDVEESILPLLVGFTGGNARQVAKIVFTRFDAAPEELLQGRNCEYSGVLLVQGVPVLDADQNEAVEETYPVELMGSDPVFVEIPFVELGASENRRVDAVLRYAVASGPLAECANWLDIGVQIVDRDTSETRSNQMMRIPAHTPEWSFQRVGDPG
jgi:hypothetical protein